MSRESAVSDAAFRGVIGLAILSFGSFIAGALLSQVELFFSAVPALVVWLVAAYYGLRQIAAGIYIVVEDAA